MFVQNIDHPVAQTRETEQAADQDKCDQIICALWCAEHGAMRLGCSFDAIGFLCHDHRNVSSPKSAALFGLYRVAGRMFVFDS